MHVFPAHGGDLSGAKRRFGAPKDGWLDLSTGISPFSYPLRALGPGDMRALPDPGLWRAVREKAAAYYGAPGAEWVAPVPGAQAAIRFLPLLREKGRAAILEPTYAEHARSWEMAGHRVIRAGSLEEAGDADMAIIVNPNNPDGARRDPAALLHLAAGMAERGGCLVVDEAFGDCDPDLSVAAHVGPHLTVLRSFGKFFGLAGLRLGFVLGDPPLIQRITDFFDCWSIGGPALRVADAALADRQWAMRARKKIREEASRLDHILLEAGLTPLGGSPLFRLVQTPRAWALYEHLGIRGVLTRPFAERPRWLRFGLTKGAAERLRLSGALADWSIP